jgi:hypothetical protein
VVVDQVAAFVGGIDLVEGRFDDFLHRVGDITDDDGMKDQHCFFPGDEYYQPNAPKKKKNHTASSHRSLSGSISSISGSSQQVPSAVASPVVSSEMILTAVVEDDNDEMDDTDAELFIGTAQLVPDPR